MDMMFFLSEIFVPISTAIAVCLTVHKIGRKPPKDKYFYGIWILGLPYGTYDYTQRKQDIETYFIRKIAILRLKKHILRTCDS